MILLLWHQWVDGVDASGGLVVAKAVLGVDGLIVASLAIDGVSIIVGNTVVYVVVVDVVDPFSLVDVEETDQLGVFACWC